MRARRRQRRQRVRRDEVAPQTLMKLWSEFRINPLNDNSLVLSDALEVSGYKRLAKEIRNLVIYGREVLLPEVLRRPLEQPISKSRAKAYAYMRENSQAFAQRRFNRVHVHLTDQIVDAISELEKKPRVQWWVNSHTGSRYALAYPIKMERQPEEPIFIQPSFFRRPGYGVVLAGKLRGRGVTVEREDLYEVPPSSVLLAPGTKHWLKKYR